MFYVWVTLMSDRAANGLAVGLIRRGFQAEALAASNELTIPGEVSTICAIKLHADHLPEKLPKDTGPQNWCMNHVTAVLNAGQDSYYSVIVQHLGGQCTWRGSNIQLPKKQEPEVATPVEPEPEPKKPPTVLDKINDAIES